MGKMRDERGLPRENTSVKRQKGGKPSARVPGDMQIVPPISPLSNRSAANYANAMKPMGGAAGAKHNYEGGS